MESFLQDLRYGYRGLRRSPALAIIAVASLGLGIGAVTTAYTWTDRFVFHALPLVDGTDRMLIANTRAPGGGDWSVSIAAFRDWRAQSRTTDLAASAFAQVGLRKGEGTERAWGLAVSSNLASVLGVQPALGRWITPDEELSPAPVVVLDHDFWRREFGGDSSIVDRAITLNGRPMTVVGVMPAGFAGDQVGLHFDLYIPIGIRHVLLGGTDPTPHRGWQFLSLTGRIRPGYTLAQAREDIDATAKRASVAAGSDVDRLGAVVRPHSQNEAARFLIQKEISFSGRNNGAVTHDFVILKQGADIGESFGTEDEANVFWEIQIPAGQTADATFTAPADPGEYQVLCGIPGHYQAGMVAKLAVAAP